MNSQEQSLASCATSIVKFTSHLTQARLHSSLSSYTTSYTSPHHDTAHSHYDESQVTTCAMMFSLTIPGIGNDVAERLLEKCGSIEEMCHKDSLKQIKGLGEVLRRRIIDVLTSEDEVKIERKTRRNL